MNDDQKQIYEQNCSNYQYYQLNGRVNIFPCARSSFFSKCDPTEYYVGFLSEKGKIKLNNLERKRKLKKLLNGKKAN